ncbi:transposase [Deinococcus aquiradiocola]|uniref:transposase n=1 Tax=Deinococcus aquiradiocola TaxID=393059 RepID=UPI003570B605
MNAGTFTEEQIVALLQNAQKGEKTVEELCRDLGCSTASCSTWKKRYGDAGVAKARRLRQLERGNDRLLKIVDQQRLEIACARQLGHPTPPVPGSTCGGQAAYRTCGWPSTSRPCSWRSRASLRGSNKPWSALPWTLRRWNSN